LTKTIELYTLLCFVILKKDDSVIMSLTFVCC
jgi:hypothetical protein